MEQGHTETRIPGPVEARLKEFEVICLVIGPCGEFSSSLEKFIERMVQVGGSRMGSSMPAKMLARGNPTAALEWRFRSTLALCAQRAEARHTLSRIWPVTTASGDKSTRGRDAGLGTEDAAAAFHSFKDAHRLVFQ